MFLQLSDNECFAKQKTIYLRASYAYYRFNLYEICIR